MAEIPTLFVCHGDDGGPRVHPCRRVQEALRASGIEYDKVVAAHGNPIPFLRKGSRDDLRSADLQGRGYLLASSAMDGRVILWQPGNKKAPKIGEHRFGAEASTIAWSPDDRSLAAGSGDGTVAMFRAG